MRYTSLTKNYEFSRVYRRGASFVHPFLVTYVLKKKKGTLKVGITSSKKTGGAVARNRARRIVRAAMVSCALPEESKYDIVFVTRTATAFQKSYDIEKVMSAHLKQAGVLPNDK